MKKIVSPLVHSENKEHQKPVSWDSDAIESLQSLERYTILKALEEGKRLIKRVMEFVSKTNQHVTKTHVQNAITSVLEEIENTKRQ